MRQQVRTTMTNTPICPARTPLGPWLVNPSSAVMLPWATSTALSAAALKDEALTVFGRGSRPAYSAYQSPYATIAGTATSTWRRRSGVSRRS
jgi:hypothetical protein